MTFVHTCTIIYRLVDKLSNNMLRQWLKYYARGILTIKKLMNILKQNFDGICQKAILRRSCTFHIPILTEIYYLAYFYRVPFFLARLAQSASIMVTYLIQDERMLILKTIRRLDIENFRVGRAWSMFLFPSSWFPIRIRNKKPVPYSLYMYFIQTSFHFSIFVSISVHTCPPPPIHGEIYYFCQNCLSLRSSVWLTFTFSPPSTANSLDLDETPSNSAIHPDPSCVTLRPHFNRLRSCCKQLGSHMQTVWIWMRRRVARPLTQIQAVWHSGHFLTDFGRVSNSLDLDQTTFSPTSDDIKALWNWSRKEV